jgi:hypothetical protein
MSIKDLFDKALLETSKLSVGNVFILEDLLSSEWPLIRREIKMSLGRVFFEEVDENKKWKVKPVRSPQGPAKYKKL